MILSQTVRHHIQCDHCQSSYVHTEGDIELFLLDHGWQIDGPEFDGERVIQTHKCPRCVRRRR